MLGLVPCIRQLVLVSSLINALVLDTGSLLTLSLLGHYIYVFPSRPIFWHNTIVLGSL